MLKPLSHETVFFFLLQLSILLGVARILGEWMRRKSQPAVIGELLAGLLLGPSVLGAVSPAAQAWLFPKQQQMADLLSAFSLLGVLLLLVVTGLEIDLKLIKRRARTAAGISLGGIVLPFASGFLLGWLLPDDVLLRPDQRVLFSLFLAVAMSISAIPVIAKVLLDLKLIRRDIGQIILAAAMLDDTIGWIVLSVVAGAASKGSIGWHQILFSFVSAGLVMGLGLALGRRAFSRFLVLVDNYAGGETAQLSAIFFVALAAASFTHAIGLEAVLGAFIVGILAGQARRLKTTVVHSLELMTGSFFAPIFFATAGLKVDLIALLTPKRMALTIFVILVASFGKYVGCYIGGMSTGMPHWERIAMGSGMNPRGAMGIIVASLGLSLGVLSPTMYSVLVGMAIVTSLMAPPLLRWSLSKVQMGPEEASRLADEASQGVSFLRSLNRILIPSRGGLNVQLASHLVGHLGHHHPVEITTLFVEGKEPSKAGSSAPVEGVDRVLHAHGLDPQIKVLKGWPIQSVILGEAQKGYDLLVLGASGEPDADQAPETLFNPVVDAILESAPCTTMVVRSHPTVDVQQLLLHTILVPVVGGASSRCAVEVAALVGAGLKAKLVLLHVTPPLAIGEAQLGHKSFSAAQLAGRALVENLAHRASKLGAQVEQRLVESTEPHTVILEQARILDCDLIFMGTSLRPLVGRAFLGHRVETVLATAPCAVAVISSP